MRKTAEEICSFIVIQSNKNAKTICFLHDLVVNNYLYGFSCYNMVISSSLLQNNDII